MSKFNLENYLPEIRAVGLDRVIVHLAVVKERNPGAPRLNFHELRQEWNKLPSAERLEQKANVAKMLSRSSRAPKEVQLPWRSIKTSSPLKVEKYFLN